MLLLVPLALLFEKDWHPPGHKNGPDGHTLQAQRKGICCTHGPIHLLNRLEDCCVVLEPLQSRGEGAVFGCSKVFTATEREKIEEKTVKGEVLLL